MLRFSFVDIWESVDEVVGWRLTPVWAIKNIFNFSQCVSNRKCVWASLIFENITVLSSGNTTVWKIVVGFEDFSLIFCILIIRAVWKWTWTFIMTKSLIRNFVQRISVLDNAICWGGAVSLKDLIRNDFRSDSYW